MKIFLGDIIKLKSNGMKSLDENDYDTFAFAVVVYHDGMNKACPIVFTRTELESISTFDLLDIIHRKLNYAFIEIDKLK